MNGSAGQWSASGPLRSRRVHTDTSRSFCEPVSSSVSDFRHLNSQNKTPFLTIFTSKPPFPEFFFWWVPLCWAFSPRKTHRRQVMSPLVRKNHFRCGGQGLHHSNLNTTIYKSTNVTLFPSLFMGTLERPCEKRRRCHKNRKL